MGVFRWARASVIAALCACGGAEPAREPDPRPVELPGRLSSREIAERQLREDAEAERRLVERARADQLARERAEAEAIERERQEALQLAAHQRELEERSRELEAERRRFEAERVPRPRAADARDDEPAAESCCKVCTRGCACGNTCISCSKTCHVGRGCACDG